MILSIKTTSLFCVIAIIIAFTDISNAQSTQAAEPAKPFITIWKTDNEGASNNNQISFLANGTDFLVEWEAVNDATINGSAIFSGNVELTFPSAGIYRVKIGEGLTGFATTQSTQINSDESDAKKIIRLEQWGDIEWQNLTYGFNFATNLEVTATDAPNLSNVTSLYALFYYAQKMNADFDHWDVSTITSLNRTFGECLVFNGNVSNWDVSNVTDFSLTFEDAKAFEGDLSGWDVSSATNLVRMFYGAEKFNSNISGWDVSNVTNMNIVFRNATAFNQDLSNWDVSNVRFMSSMFQSASSFSSDLSSWNVGNVITMENMFSSATVFNCDLNSWDVSNVTNMRAMFFSARNFNGNVSDWIVSKVTNFGLMFGGASSFNQDLSKWDVSSATNLEWMFNGSSAFTSDLSSWNVSKVTNFNLVFANAKVFTSDLSNWDVSKGVNFEWMFLGAENFTSDLSKWDVSNATKLNRMFYDASSFTSDLSSWNVSQSPDLNAMFYRSTKFDSDLSSWNVSNATNLANFADQTALSTANIDKMLRAWAELDVQENVTLGLSQRKYRFAKAAVEKLQSDKGWNITAQECDNCTYTMLRGKEGWRMISVPFPDVTVAQLLEPFWTQGVEGADMISETPNVLVYNVENEAFVPISTLNQTFPAGTGLLVWVYADDDAMTPGVQGGFPKVIERTDSEHDDDVTPTLNSAPGESETVGWTLLGNPFNAPVRWNKLVRGGGIGNSVYVWSARDSSYVSFNGAVGGLSRGVLAPFQGFWIQNKSNGAREFKFQKSAKEDTISFYSKSAETQYIKLEIHQNERTNSAWVMFDERASLDKDDLDALKLAPLSTSYIQLATIDPQDLALDIQAVPIITTALHLPLLATSTYEGTSTISLLESTIPDTWVVYLKDLNTQQLIPFSGEPIPMEISTVKAKQNPSLKPEVLLSGNSPNYEIIVSPDVLTSSEPEILPNQLTLYPSYPNPFNPTTSLRFSLPEADFVQLSIFDINGRKVTDLIAGTRSAGSHSVVWDASQQSSGTYLARLTVNGKTMHQKLTLLK